MEFICEDATIGALPAPMGPIKRYYVFFQAISTP